MKQKDLQWYPEFYAILQTELEQEVGEGRYVCGAIREVSANEIQEAELRAKSWESKEEKEAEATRYSQLILKLKECQQLDDTVRVAKSPELLQQLYQELGFSN